MWHLMQDELIKGRILNSTFYFFEIYLFFRCII